MVAFPRLRLQRQYLSRDSNTLLRFSTSECLHRAEFLSIMVMVSVGNDSFLEEKKDLCQSYQKKHHHHRQSYQKMNSIE